MRLTRLTILLAAVMLPLLALNAGAAEKTDPPPDPLEKAWEMFIEALPAMDTDFDRALACATAAEKIGAKSPEITLALLQQAQTYRFSEEMGPERAIINKKLISGFSAVDPYQALLMADDIPDDDEREFLLSELAAPILTIDARLAYGLAESLEIPIHRVNALTTMASWLIEEEEEATRELLKVVADDFATAQPRVDALDAAGEFLPLMHRLEMKEFNDTLEQALKNLKGLSDKEQLSRAQAALAPVVALEDPEKALELIANTPQLDYRAVATAKIGAVIRSEDRSKSSLLFKQAIDLAGSGGTGFFLDDPIPDVARVIAPHKPQQAFREALVTGDRAIRLEVCREILIAASPDSARKMLKEVIKEDYVSHMLEVCYFARRPEEPGAQDRIDQAVEAFMKLHQFLRDENMPVILGDLAVYDGERALNMAASIKDSRVKIAALGEIIRALTG